MSASALSQSGGGATVEGTVKDASGAVIREVKLTLTRIETGVRTNLATNNDGYFVTPPLPIGKYQIRCEASGMKAWEKDLQLRVSFDVFNVFDLQGLNPPGTNGVASLRSSYGGFGFRPRQAQASMRLEF